MAIAGDVTIRTIEVERFGYLVTEDERIVAWFVHADDARSFVDVCGTERMSIVRVCKEIVR